MIPSKTKTINHCSTDLLTSEGAGRGKEWEDVRYVCTVIYEQITRGGDNGIVLLLVCWILWKLNSLRMFLLMQIWDNKTIYKTLF